MMKKIRLILPVLAALFMMAGCFGEDVPEDENISKLESGNLIVRENVNELNVSVTGFDTFNPIMTKSESVAEFMKTVCEPLFEYDEAGNPIAVLAKNYMVSGDGTVVSFEVEPVLFHDSSVLTPADVVYTVEMIMKNDTLYSDSVKYIKEIFADVSGRVYICLSEPVINFSGMLNFPIVKNATPQTAEDTYIPVGTGPYKYLGKEASGRVTFTANDAWHGGEVGFKNIIVNLLKDKNTVMHAFDAGETDVLVSKNLSSEDITPRGEYIRNEYVSNNLTFLGINNNKKKLSGKFTRKALELLIDRQKIIDVEVYSKGEAARIPVNPSFWFYPEFPEEVHDYEAVMALLQKDGWVRSDAGYYRDTNGEREKLSLKILVNKENAEKMRIAKNISSALNSFGITTELRALDFDLYRINVTDMSYDLFIGEVLLDMNMDPSFLTSSSGNYFGYENSLMDSVLWEMKTTSDSTMLIEAFKRYGELFLEEVPFIPLFFRKQSVIYSKNIAGITPPTLYNLYRDIDKWYISKTR